MFLPFKKEQKLNNQHVEIIIGDLIYLYSIFKQDLDLPAVPHSLQWKHTPMLCVWF